MDVARRIIFLTYDGAELLDLAGPAAVFSTANRLSGKRLYEVVVASSPSGAAKHSCDITLVTTSLGDLEFGPADTVLVIGADRQPLMKAMTDKDLVASLQTASARAERIGSICTGAFPLAAAGLAAGKDVATHWAATAEFDRLYPDARCDGDALYVTDGKLWTSAGVTTGIDMALAMVEADHGAALKASIARYLVVYAHRPGHQSQFSDLLAAQAKEDQRFAGLTSWLCEQVAMSPSIEQMANHVGMSPRTFQRRFVEIFGETPGKFFEALRLNAARGHLEAGTSVANAALQAGFKSESAFRTAFKAKYGVTPTDYRRAWPSV